MSSQKGWKPSVVSDFPVIILSIKTTIPVLIKPKIQYSNGLLNSIWCTSTLNIILKKYLDLPEVERNDCCVHLRDSKYFDMTEILGEWVHPCLC